MNATPAPEDRHRPQASGACDTQAQLAPERGTTVPRQKDGSQEAEHLHGSTADLLEHPDPGTAAQAAAVENLLRCWVRENDLAEPPHGTLRIPLPASGTALLIPVHHWSVTGWHRFGMPHLQDGPLDAPRVDAVTVAALLSREASGPGSAAAVRGGVPARGADGSGADVAAGSGVVRRAGDRPGADRLVADPERSPAHAGRPGGRRCCLRLYGPSPGGAVTPSRALSPDHLPPLPPQPLRRRSRPGRARRRLGSPHRRLHR